MDGIARSEGDDIILVIGNDAKIIKEYGLKKSISACIIAQIKKDKTMTKEFAKNYCEKEIKKNK